MTCHGVFDLPFNVTLPWSGATHRMSAGPHRHPDSLPPALDLIADSGPRKDCNLSTGTCSVPGLEVGKRPVAWESPSKQLWRCQPWVRMAAAKPCLRAPQVSMPDPNPPRAWVQSSSGCTGHSRTWIPPHPLPHCGNSSVAAPFTEGRAELGREWGVVGECGQGRRHQVTESRLPRRWGAGCQEVGSWQQADRVWAEASKVLAHALMFIRFHL